MPGLVTLQGRNGRASLLRSSIDHTLKNLRWRKFATNGGANDLLLKGAYCTDILEDFCTARSAIANDYSRTTFCDSQPQGTLSLFSSIFQVGFGFDKSAEDR
jgi:hypothetical protein